MIPLRRCPPVRSRPPARRLAALALLTVLGLPWAAPSRADEGMWLLNDFPHSLLRSRYGFTPTQEQLDHLKSAAVRFGRGGTGSFVSGDGLVLTNHHVGIDCIQKLSSADRDLVGNGFVAADRSQELRCPDGEVLFLTSIERITYRVEAASAGITDLVAANRARQSAVAAIETQCKADTGLHCEVMKLFGGAVYDLYRFHRYTDVRLAFAPEIDIVKFGGDTDNFDFPRYSLDFALFRVYEQDKPIRPPHFLRWNPRGIADGDVVIAAGHPGNTQRGQTVAQWEHARDLGQPLMIAEFVHLRDLMRNFSARGPEQARLALRDLLAVENTIKGRAGLLGGLLEPERFAEKQRREQALRGELAANAVLAARFGDPWAEIERAVATQRTLEARFRLLEGGIGNSLRLPWIARQLVRLPGQKAKPDGERLREFQSAGLPVLEQRLFSSAPIYADFDQARLAAWLWRVRTQLGHVHPLVLGLLGRRTPEEVAAEVIGGTKLQDPAVRRALADGGQAAIDASSDPLIRFFRQLEPTVLELRERWDDEVDGVVTIAAGRIAQAEAALAALRTDGAPLYPDATGSLRLSFGRVAGYTEAGQSVPAFSRLQGYYERSEANGNQAPYELPKALGRLRGQLPGDLPWVFATTLDTTGGNSGSAVVNRDLELVGVLFDGNLYSLANVVLFDDRTSRSLIVDVRAMDLALRRLYPATHLADELAQRPR